MYNIGEFAEKVGITVKTLQKWDREGRLVAKRTLTNRRYYTQEDLAKVLNLETEQKARQTIVYSRVSSTGQRADLANQRRLLEQFCAGRGLAVDEWVEEIGGGLNLKRPKFLKLIEGVLEGKVSTIIVAHKDRLARFGYELVSYLCERESCELIVMNNEQLSPEAEVVQDLWTIVHSFSVRLDGLRNYKQALKKALNDDTSA